MSEPKQLNNDELFETAKSVLARRVWSNEAENVFREVLNRLDYHIGMQKFRSQMLPKRAVRRERERIIALLEDNLDGKLHKVGNDLVTPIDEVVCTTFRGDIIRRIKGEEQ